MRIVFMGSDPIALPLLNWLAGEGRRLAQIVGVYTQPDRPAGRGQKTQIGAIKQWSLDRGIPLFQPEKLRREQQETLAGLAPDASLVMAYGHILRDEFIGVPRLGTLNLHVSLLPKYRGASPIQAAICEGERETGVSLMRIVRELDAGPVADRESVPIGPLDTAADVESKLAAASVPLVARALPKLAVGTLEFLPQDDTRATFCRRLTKADGTLDFHQKASFLAARINGLHPWPGCSVTVDGLALRFGQAEAIADNRESAVADHGKVLESIAGGLDIQTGSGVLRVLRLQRPGGRMLPAREFLRGFPVAAGTVLPSQAMESLASSMPFGSSRR